MPPEFPDPNNPQVNTLLHQLNRCADFISATIVQTSQDSKRFMFSIWAVNNVAPPIIGTICERLFGEQVSNLSQANKSRLTTIANLLDKERTVAWFVLGKTSGNGKIPTVKPPRPETPELRDILIFQPVEDRVSETPEVQRAPLSPFSIAIDNDQSISASLAVSDSLVLPEHPQGALNVSSGQLHLPPSSPITYRSSSPVESVKRQSEPEPIGGSKRQAVHIETRSVTAHHLQLPRFKRTEVPFLQLVGSINRTLAPGAYLNDNIINTAIARLASETIGVFNKNKSLVLFPVYDSTATHWRLYVWQDHTGLKVFDSMVGLVDSTLQHVRDLVFEAIGAPLLRTIMVQCDQQTNSIDCGLYVIKFAQLVASGDALVGPRVTPDTRDNLAFELLTSSAAMLPPPTHQGSMLALHVKVRQQLSTLRDRLVNWDLPFSPVANSNTIALEHHK
ncbi:hypothetical protein ACHAPU_010132 [Fusarium lateritium]